ncbi:TMV resistance protein N-like protein [Tanacetum coccineum]
MTSISSSSIQKSFRILKQKGIETYKDDERIIKGSTINKQLIKSIEESRFYIIFFSKTYASSSWCLDELVKIIECQKSSENIAFPVFYDVEPTKVWKQKGLVGEAFAKHKKEQAAWKLVEAMKEASNLVGDESKLIEKIVDDIFGKLYVFSDPDIRVSSVSGGKHTMIQMMHRKKVLVVLDDVDHIDQLEALAGKPNWFKLGSMIIITTRDEFATDFQEILRFSVTLLTDFRLKQSSLKSRHCSSVSSFGLFLRGKNMIEWKDAIERLKTIPLKETVKILDLNYDGLENDYKEIFLYVACILKGEQKDTTIRVL